LNQSGRAYGFSPLIRTHLSHQPRNVQGILGALFVISCEGLRNEQMYDTGDRDPELIPYFKNLCSRNQLGLDSVAGEEKVHQQAALFLTRWHQPCRRETARPILLNSAYYLIPALDQLKNQVFRSRIVRDCHRDVNVPCEARLGPHRDRHATHQCPPGPKIRKAPAEVFQGAR